MTYRGTVKGGVVLLPEGASLPDGAQVEVTEAKPAGEEVGVLAKLAELGRWAETQPTDLPEDLSENLDHYLHGQPKRS